VKGLVRIAWVVALAGLLGGCGGGGAAVTPPVAAAAPAADDAFVLDRSAWDESVWL
jgi:hypothetical protein